MPRVNTTHLNTLVPEVTSSNIQSLQVTHTTAGAEAQADYVGVSHCDKNRI